MNYQDAIKLLGTKAPAALVTTYPHNTNNSSRYFFLSTIEVIKPFLKNGWRVLDADQASTHERGSVKDLETIHRIDLAPPNELHKIVPAVCIENSHDGQTSLNLYPEIFLCREGIGTIVYRKPIRISHNAKAAHPDRISESIERIPKVSEKELLIVENMQKKPLSVHISKKLAAQVRKKVYSRTDWNELLLYNPQVPTNLWEGFQTIQKSILWGGIKIQHYGGRSATLKGIYGITRKIKVTATVWEICKKYL